VVGKNQFTPKNIPMHNPKRYRALSTFKKEKKIIMAQAINPIPKKLSKI
jgi:hypothetical protein